MCTAVSYLSNGLYFGRTLDNDCSYGEEIVITPRRYPLELRGGGATYAHFAYIGVAKVEDGMPLYYDAVNEKGLCMAGLNFVGNAVYGKPASGKTDVATFELIHYVLSRFATVEQARAALFRINITDVPYSEKLPHAELHWMISDKKSNVVVECEKTGMHVYDNPAGVLTNNPPFPQQLMNLNNYMCVSPKPPRCAFSDKLVFDKYSRGMGGIGLPGDLSSESRFVRAAFTALNSPQCDCEEKSVGQFFHILDTVAQTRGSCVLDGGAYETTIYASCCSAERGIYYYNSYDNRRIYGVDMNAENLDGKDIMRFPFVTEGGINIQNKHER